MPADNRLLCYILTDKGRRHYWAGPGMRPIGSQLPNRIPRWPTFAEARAAASGLFRGMGIVLVPTPMRVT